MMDKDALVVVVALVIVALVLIPTIFYLLTLHKALTRVDDGRRQMSAGLVWLNLIPVFGLGWHFYTIIKVADSLAAELGARGIAFQGRPGFALGLTTSILWVVSIIPYLGIVAGLAGLVCWIIYWVQIAGFSRQIANPA